MNRRKRTGLGMLGLSCWRPEAGSTLEKVKIAAMGALAMFVALKIVQGTTAGVQRT